MNKVKKSNLDIFLDIIRSSFLGSDYSYQDRVYHLEPTVVKAYDFVRKIEKPKSQYEKLLSSLDESFKSPARTEIYRKKHGWIAQGVDLFHRIRAMRIGPSNETYLVPVLSVPCIGVDSSGFDEQYSVFAFCFFADDLVGSVFLEKHLQIPRGWRNEFKWSDLDDKFKGKIIENFNFLTRLCCEGLLVIKTNLFEEPRIMKPENAFVNLIYGCFSGYERLQGELRSKLRKKFFQLANNKPMHCDNDFQPLSVGKVVRLFVKTLSKSNGGYEKHTPVHVLLQSHESTPIQLADIISGASKLKILKNDIMPLTQLYFDLRKVKKGKGQKIVKAYYWTS